MITKEAFCAIIRALEKTKKCTDELCDDLYAVFMKHRPEQDIDLRGYQLWPCVYDSKLEDAVVNALEQEMEDEENSWISYYIYELEFGTRDYAGKCGTNPDGSNISLTTPEELYDFLVSCIREKRAAQIFGTAADTHKEQKVPYEHTTVFDGGGTVKIMCFDYDGPEDRIALQMFTKMYFQECGDVLRGKSAKSDLTVHRGDTVIEHDGSYYTVPRNLIQGR